MSATALAKVSSVENAPRGVLSDNEHDPHIYMTIGRMLDFCNTRPMTEPFTARGIVIDTTADIAAQLRDFFPSHLDMSVLMDRMTEVCMERARATGQYLQVLSFDHLKQIKPIDTDQGNFETFIEVFADRRVKLSQYTGIKTALKAGAGGSGGGDPHQMLAEIRQAEIQGFALQIKSLDISDAKATELLGKMGIAQAFGSDGAAMGGALETLAKGGPEAKALQAVIEQVAELKTLRTALANAPDAAAAQPIAAAVALKTEALSAQVQTIQATTPQVAAAIQANVTRTVESVKVVLAARQIEIAVTQLSAALPASIVKVANDLGRNTMSVQIAGAVAAVQAVARTSNLSVRDVVALVMTKNATPAMTKAVESLTTLMAKPDFLPTLEAGVSPRVALAVRETLTAPVLQAVSSVPTSISNVAQTLRTLGEKSGVPTIVAAAAVLSTAGHKVAAESISPSLNLPQLQAVVDNLKAVAMTSAVPPAMKAELASVTAQIEAITVQMRSPEPSVIPTAAQPLPLQAPLSMVAQALDIKTPNLIAAPIPAVAEFKGAPNHWGESPNAASSRTATIHPLIQPTGQDNTPVARAPEAPLQVQPTLRSSGTDATPAAPATQGVSAKAEAPRGETPSGNAPRAEAPKAEAPKGEIPKADAPKADAPKVETLKTDVLKAEVLKGEMPRVEAPKVEALKTEVPKVETVKTDAPKTEALKTEAPKQEAPKVEAPKAETPKTDNLKVETPKETPKTETLKVDTPVVDTPKDVLKVETPKADAPKVETPKDADVPPLVQQAKVEVVTPPQGQGEQQQARIQNPQDTLTVQDNLQVNQTLKNQGAGDGINTHYREPEQTQQRQQETLRETPARRETVETMRQAETPKMNREIWNGPDGVTKTGMDFGFKPTEDGRTGVSTKTKPDADKKADQTGCGPCTGERGCCGKFTAAVLAANLDTASNRARTVDVSRTAEAKRKYVLN